MPVCHVIIFKRFNNEEGEKNYYGPNCNPSATGNFIRTIIA